MSENHDSLTFRPAQAVAYYTVLCLAALAVILLLLFQSGCGYWSFLPTLLGLLALLRRWSLGPPIVLLMLAVLLKVYPPYRSDARVPDFILSAAVLGYATAHYRLQSLLVHVFPLDPRRRDNSSERRGKVVQQQRSPRLVTQQEIGALVLTLPLCATAGLLFWKILPRELNALGLSPVIWRAIFLVWFLGVGLMATRSILQYLVWRCWTPQEAALLLQDWLWRETRREQWRLNQWLAWARLRYARQKKSEHAGSGKTYR